jgi:hypothetical protein
MKDTILNAIHKKMFYLESSRIHTEIEITGSVNSPAQTLPTLIEQSLLTSDFFSNAASVPINTIYVLKSPYGPYHIIALTIDVPRCLQQLNEFLARDGKLSQTILQSHR